MPFLDTVYFVYENHDANQEIKYTIGILRLIPDFAYLSETFLRYTKVWVKDWNRIKNFVQIKSSSLARTKNKAQIMIEKMAICVE